MMSARVAAFALYGLAVSAAGTDAPPFPRSDPDAWIGAPQILAELRGKVVLLDVWTFG